VTINRNGFFLLSIIIVNDIQRYFSSEIALSHGYHSFCLNDMRFRLTLVEIMSIKSLVPRPSRSAVQSCDAFALDGVYCTRLLGTSDALRSRTRTGFYCRTSRICHRRRICRENCWAGKNWNRLTDDRTLDKQSIPGDRHSCGHASPFQRQEYSCGTPHTCQSDQTAASSLDGTISCSL
jgi:hypothetical protein